MVPDGFGKINVDLNKVDEKTNLALFCEFVGDSVWALYLKMLAINNGLLSYEELEKFFKKVENAQFQSEFLKILEEKNFFSVEEKAKLKYFRNKLSFKRHKKLKGDVYNRSSTLEAMLGYMYLNQNEKFYQIIQEAYKFANLGN